ncbi:MAG: hypothetical protein ACK55I_43295, partial [bacterium]
SVIQTLGLLNYVPSDPKELNAVFPHVHDRVKPLRVWRVVYYSFSCGPLPEMRPIFLSQTKQRETTERRNVSLQNFEFKMDDFYIFESSISNNDPF